MHGRFLIPFVLLSVPAAVLAQNYNSSMNSAERARESQRYESALLEGTYNNPMLEKSSVDMSLAYRGIGQAQRDEEQAKWEKQQREQQRLYEAQLEKERQEAAEAYYQARQREAYEKHIEFERNYARNGMNRWGFQDFSTLDEFAKKAEQVRQGKIDAVSPLDRYGVALALRRLKAEGRLSGGGSDTEALVAKLALKAVDEGDVLPALLLSDGLLQDREFLELLALEATDVDRILAVYATGGYGWPAEDEIELIRIHNLATTSKLNEITSARAKLRDVTSPVVSTDPRYMVLRLLRMASLAPWHHGHATLSFRAQDELQALRQARPALGYFATALYEERVRFDASQPSRWSEFMFERAAQIAGPGLIRELARQRREASSVKEAAVFKRWLELQGLRDTSALASLDAQTLWRVAGRLILGHHLDEFSADLADTQNPESIRRRLEYAHALLWELTQRGDRPAFAIQYLAAIQAPEAAAPSLLAYLNAFHWLLGWDTPPTDLEEAPVIVASLLEVMPWSQPGRYYADSVAGKALQLEAPDILKDKPYAMAGSYSWYSTGYLEALPLQAAVVPAVALHRNRIAVEAKRLNQLVNTIRPTGFGARLARQQQLVFAKIIEDAYLQKWAGECLEKLAAEKAPSVPGEPPSALRRSLDTFGEAGLHLFGSSLLCEPLSLAAAPDSERLLEAIAVRNLAVKPFIPYVATLPFPYASRTTLFAEDSALRRMVAAQALNNLDESLAEEVNLHASEVGLWLKDGAVRGEALCRLRSAQLVLRGGALGSSVGLSATQASVLLEESVSTGVPGAVEFAFERARNLSKALPVDTLLESVKTAWTRGSPLAAQAWLDALDENRVWTPEQALLETKALRVARDDSRSGSTERWWKALCAWSEHLRGNRELLVGRPEADAVAREVARLVQQCDAIAKVCPKGRQPIKNDRIFPHLADASANLPSSAAATRLREVFTASAHVKTELRYGSFVPLQAALLRARSAETPKQREFAALDAARWYTINRSSQVEFDGYLIVNSLPDEPDQHPLWEAESGLRFTALGLLALRDFKAVPDSFARNVRKIAGVIGRLKAPYDPEGFKRLVENYSDLALSMPFRKELGERPEGALLIDAFDRLARENPAEAQALYAANLMLAPRDYALSVFERIVKPGSSWVSLTGNCCRLLTAADHAALLRRILERDTGELEGGRSDIIEWASVGVQKASAARGDAASLELAAVLRQLASRWALVESNTADQWATTAFVLALHADWLSPSFEKSGEILRLLQPRSALMAKSPALREAVRSWKDSAFEGRNVDLLRLLEPIAPDMVSDAIDELEGFPRRNAAQKEYERKQDLIKPCLTLLEERRNVPLALRTLHRLSQDGLTIHGWTQLNAVKAACLDAKGTVALPGDPKLFAIVIDFLSFGSSCWDEDDDMKAFVLSLSPVAKRLYEIRSTWSHGLERELQFLAFNYARVGEAWALSAVHELGRNPSPGLRVALWRSGLGSDFGVPPLTAEEAKLPVFVEAARLFDVVVPPADDPVSEMEAYIASSSR